MPRLTEKQGFDMPGMPRFRTRPAWAGAVVVSAALVAASVAAPAGAAVTDDAAFRAAFTNAATTAIILGGNVDLQCPALVRGGGTALTITGNGFRLTQHCAGADILRLSGAGSLTLNNVTLDGNAKSSGIGIHSTTAPVTLSGSTITAAGGDGIDIDESANVVLTNSTITGVAGTGIATFGGTTTLTRSTITGTGGDGIASNGSAHLTSSTIANNDGNGVDSNGANNTLTNSTVTGNNGTALATAGTMTLVYATIVNNNLLNSNGFNLHFNGGGTFVAFGSVIARSAGGAAANCDTGGTYTSHGFNFSDDDTCFTNSSDIFDGGSPKLGSLAANGGATKTLLPQSGSPLIDAIPTASCRNDGASGVTTDQRSVARPAQHGCDIGSVEVAPPVATTTTTPAPTTTTPPATEGTTAASTPITAAAATTTPTATGGTQLPRTGNNGATAAVGLGTLLAGAAMLSLSRRRRSRSAS